MSSANDHQNPKIPRTNFSQPFEGLTADRSSFNQSSSNFEIGSRQTPPHPRLFGWVVGRLLIGLGLALLALAIFAGLTAYRFNQVAKSVFRGGTEGAFALQVESDPQAVSREGDSRVNLLLIGRGGLGHDGPNLTDSIIVVSIDPNGQSAALLSLPRDWQVELEYEPETWVRINAVYTLSRDYNYLQTGSLEMAEAAGLESLEATIESLLDLEIHYHILVDFKGFVALIDAVGGVEFDIPKRLYDVRASLDLQPGRQVLDGQQALAYARARYTVVGGDFGRSTNQRDLLLALKDKLSTSGLLTNFFRANQAIDALDNSVVANLSFDEAKRLYRIIADFGPESFASLDLVSDPVLLVPVDDDGRAVLWPAAGRDDYGPIQAFVRQQLPDSFILQEAASLVVWQLQSDPDDQLLKQLQSYGYQIVGSGRSQFEVTTPTLIVNNAHAPYTTSYLAKRFGATVVSSDNFEFNGGIEAGPSADLVLILTGNEAEI